MCPIICTAVYKLAYTLCTPKKHVTIFYNNLNNKCPITIILAYSVVRLCVIERWFHFPPHLSPNCSSNCRTCSHMFFSETQCICAILAVTYTVTEMNITYSTKCTVKQNFHAIIQLFFPLCTMKEIQIFCFNLRKFIKNIILCTFKKSNLITNRILKVVSDNLFRLQLRYLNIKNYGKTSGVYIRNVRIYLLT